MANEFFKWNGMYETGLIPVDAEHRRLVELINQVGRRRLHGGQAADVEAAVAALTEYAGTHFRTEEALMAAEGVSAAHSEAHRRSHQAFLAEVRRTVATARDLPTAVDGLLKYLVKWLAFHILGQDTEMAAEIAALRRGLDPDAARREALECASRRDGVLFDALNELFDNLGGAYADLAAAHAQLRQAAKRADELARSIIVVQEEERRRLSCALHDGFGANLVATRMTLSRVRDALAAAGMRESMESLAAAEALLDDTSTRVRDICLDLRPSALDHFGLVPALRGYAQQLQERTGIRVEVRAPGMRRLERDLEATAFRIAQEALTNCARHSGAREVELLVEPGPQHLRLTVRDDGIGFEPAAPREGRGLITMRERAELAGGRLEIESRPLGGTRITAEI